MSKTKLATIDEMRSMLAALSVSKTKKKRKRNRGTTKERRLVKYVTGGVPPPNGPRKTPFRDVGSILGKHVGKFFKGVPGAAYAENVGKWLGSGIGSIFGSGDYTVTGPTPDYNVLTGSTQIPNFSGNGRGVMICHREYLSDIIGTAGFNPTAYALNPGISTTFPWLSTIAPSFQEYMFHGLIFEFRPLITDFVTGGAPGVVVMSTLYNADAPIFTSKQQMENSEFATSVKPTCGLMHGVECAVTDTILPEKYVRSGAVPAGQDLRLYDLGNFVFATQTNPIVDLGELWVSYCVEFYKPVLDNPAGGGQIPSGFANRAAVTSAAPLGTIGLQIIGALALSITPTVISWTAQPQQVYYVDLNWFAGAHWAPSYPGVVLGGLAYQPLKNGGTSPLWEAPEVTATATSASNEDWSAYVICTALNPTVVTMTFGTGATFYTGSGGTLLDVLVTAVNSAI